MAGQPSRHLLPATFAESCQARPSHSSVGLCNDKGATESIVRVDVMQYPPGTAVFMGPNGVPMMVPNFQQPPPLQPPQHFQQFMPAQQPPQQPPPPPPPQHFSHHPHQLHPPPPTPPPAPPLPLTELARLCAEAVASLTDGGT